MRRCKLQAYLFSFHGLRQRRKSYDLALTAILKSDLVFVYLILPSWDFYRTFYLFIVDICCLKKSFLPEFSKSLIKSFCIDYEKFSFTENFKMLDQSRNQ